MKKLHTILISISAALFVCICVLLALFLRGEYCRVTFICEAGCEHTAWFRKGEAATVDAVAEDHKEEHADQKVIYLVYEDEERVSYYFDTPLYKNRATYYIKTCLGGPLRVQRYHFNTPYGDVLVAITFEEARDSKDHGTNLIEDRFYTAYEKLGGDRDEVLTYIFRFKNTKEWTTYEYPTAEEYSINPFAMLSSYYSVNWFGSTGGSHYRYYVEQILVTKQADWANSEPLPC